MKENNIRKSICTELKIAKTLLIMVSVFTLSMLPITILNFWKLLDPSINRTDLKNFNSKKYETYKKIFHITIVVLFYNSFWNYFIYQRRDKDFKKVFGRLKNSVLRKFRIRGEKEFLARNETVKSSLLLKRKTDIKTVNKITTSGVPDPQFQVRPDPDPDFFSS